MKLNTDKYMDGAGKILTDILNDPADRAPCGCCYIVTKPVMDIAINELAVRIGAMELIDQLCKGTSPLGPNMSLQESIIYTLDGTEAKLKDFIRNEALAVLMEQLFGRKKKEKKDPTTKDPTTELLDLLDMTLYRDNNDKVRP